jgi:hypothetical protein
MSSDKITRAEQQSVLSEREIYEVRSFADKLGISFGMAKHLIDERDEDLSVPDAPDARDA